MKQLLLFSFVIFILSAFDGKAQTSLEFDGVDDYVQTDYPGIFLENDRTFQAWIYLSAAPTVDMCILDYGFEGDGARNTFMVNEDGYLQFDGGGPEILTAVSVVPIGSWVHVAFTYNTDGAILYQNWQQVGSSYLDLFTLPDEENFRIGESVADESIPFEGMIDEVSVWDVVLTGQEIYDYACIGDPSTYPELVVYYDFNDGTGTTLTELVDGWDGTLMNMDESDWVASDVCWSGYNISFVVTQDDGTTPIENAEVDLDGDVDYTDANGEVTFESYDAGTYGYTVSKTDYDDETGSVVVTDADETVYVSMTYTGSTYNVTFTVTDGTDPIENALVDLGGTEQYTDATGVTIFTEVIPGSYSYLITKYGYFPYLNTIEVVDDDVTVEVSLPAEYPTALDFDGVDDYVQTTYTGVFGATPRTFQAWIYLSAAPTSNICITDYGVNATGSRNTFIVNGNGYLAYLSGGTNGNITATVATVPIGSWVYVAFVYDGTDGYLYQNGEQVGTGNLTGVNTPSGGNNFKIGQRVSGGSIPFEGMIDEVRFWNVALTLQEVMDYACIDDPFIYDNLVAYYNFNNGTGTTLTEHMGGFDGTLMNMDEEDWVGSVVCESDVYNITFVVTEDDGVTPIENASVDLDGDIKYTDASGEAIFQYYDPGTYNYTVTKVGFTDETGTVDVVDDDVLVDVSLTLTGISYDITFIVTDDLSGDPVDNALVDLDGAQQYTNASGQTVFTEYLSGTYPYTITIDGYFSATGNVDVIDADVTIEVSLQLDEGTTALDFDGVDDYVQTTYAGVFGTTPRTFQAWINLSAAPSSTICISDYGVNAAGSRNTFIVNGSGYLAYLSGGTNGGITASVATVPIGSWVHVAFVYDGTNGFLYQDGDQVGTGNLTGVNTPSGGENFKIGQRVSGGSIPFEGMIDEVRVWDVALTQQEIIDFACIGDPSLYDSLVAYYNFNDGTGTTLTDLVGGYDGTLMNMDEEDWVASNVCVTDIKNIIFVVTEDDGTTPIENATIDLDGAIKYTNADGEATFFNYNPGTYNYTISKTGYFDETGTVEVIDDDVTVDVSLTLTGIDYDITFIVTDDLSGDPVENALVDLEGVQQYTDASGETVFTDYITGTYNYSVTKDSYVEQTGSVEVLEEDVIENVSLQPYFNITFIVTDEISTNPIEDAVVELDGIYNYTNEFGEVDFTGYFPGTYDYTVSKDDYYEQSGSVEVIDENVTVNIALTPFLYYDITFIVTDEQSGDPVENAWVDLDGTEQYTNASGETTFSGLTPGIYPYSIIKDGYLPASGNVEVVDENVTIETSIQIAEEGTTALNFDGIDEYVQTTFSGIFETNLRTFMAWIYLDAAPSSNICISDYGENAAGSRNTFIVNGNGYLAYLSGGTNGNITASVATVPIGEWVHVAFVYDGTNGYLYQDGEQVGTGLLTGVNTPIGGADFRIGQRVPGGNIPFNGIIDEVSVWDVALTQLEVIDYVCVGDPSQYENVLVFYNFNEGTGTTLIDLVGGNNGILMNMEEEDWVASEACTGGYNISFVVLEEDGTTPVENATVDLDGDVKYTDENGEAVYIYYAPGTYDYTISKSGYYEQTGTVEVIDENITVEIVLPLIVSYDVSFAVVEIPGGGPVENALVNLDGIIQFTNENGETTFTDYLPGTYSYSILKDGYEFEMGDVEVIDEDVLVEVELLLISIGENAFSEINVFPNPTSGILNIHLKEETTCNVIISDISGRVINRFIIYNSNEKIDLSGVQKGMYVIKLQQNNDIVTLPLLIR